MGRTIKPSSMNICVTLEGEHLPVCVGESGADFIDAHSRKSFESSCSYPAELDNGDGSYFSKAAATQGRLH